MMLHVGFGLVNLLIIIVRTLGPSILWVAEERTWRAEIQVPKANDYQFGGTLAPHKSSVLPAALAAAVKCFG